MDIRSRVKGALYGFRTSITNGWNALLVNGMNPLNIGTSFHDLNTNGFNKNPDYRGSIDTLTASMQQLVWEVFDGEGDDAEKIPGHALEELIENPNKDMSDAVLFSIMVPHLQMAGAFYLTPLIVNGVPEALYILPPDQMSVRLNANGTQIVGFTQTLADGGTVPYEAEEVLYIWYPDPANYFQPSAPGQTAATALAMGNGARAWNAAMIENSSNPPGIYRMPVGYESRDKEVHARNKAKIKERNAGAANAGEDLYLEGPVEYTPLPNTVIDSDWLSGLTQSGKDIAKSTRVPALLLDTGIGTFENSRVALETFHKLTVVPMAEWIASSFTNYFRMYWPDIFVTFDHDNVAYLADTFESTSKALAIADYLTINEKREVVNREAIDDGDVIMVNSAKTTLEKVLSGDDDGGQRYQKRKTIDEWEDDRAPFDKSFEDRFTRVLNRQTRGLLAIFDTYAEMLIRGDEASYLAAVEGLVIDYKPVWDNVLRDSYRKITPTFARDTFNEVSDRDAEPYDTRALLDNWVNSMMSYFNTVSGKKISGITETSRQELIEATRQSLVEGTAEGESIDKIRNRLRGKVDNLTKVRAERIARTEVLQSSNRASLEGAASTGLPMNKTWLTAGDERVRAAHGAADGQEVQMGETFSVGGEGLDHPGDSQHGSAGNVINCRCAMTFEVL